MLVSHTAHTQTVLCSFMNINIFSTHRTEEIDDDLFGTTPTVRVQAEAPAAKDYRDTAVTCI